MEVVNGTSPIPNSLCEYQQNVIAQQQQQLQEQQQQLQSQQLQLDQLQQLLTQQSQFPLSRSSTLPLFPSAVQSSSSSSTDVINPELNRSDSNLSSDNNTHKWQVVVSKRKRSKSNSPENQKQPKRQSANVTNIPTDNRFSDLELINDDEPNNKTSNDNHKSNNIQKVQKPPPIFLPGVNDFHAMTETLQKAVNKEEYCCKLVGQDTFKILPATPEAYRSLTKYLIKEEIKFHSYQLKQERAFRIVLRNIHPTVNIDELKTEIEENGHTVRNIHNCKHRVTKIPLPVFFIDLEPKDNNKDVYKLQYLQNTKIIIEAPRVKRDLVQCHRCQSWEHTKHYCNHPYRCVVCGENHDSKNCDKKKNKTILPKCALCDGPHTASYKGCEIYQKIRNKKYPQATKTLQHSNYIALQTKVNTDQENVSQLRATSTNNLHQRGTYAQALNSSQQKNSLNNNALNMESNNQLFSIIQQSFERFETILSRQAEQINALLNLVSKLLTKL